MDNFYAAVDSAICSPLLVASNAYDPLPCANDQTFIDEYPTNTAPSISNTLTFAFSWGRHAARDSAGRTSKLNSCPTQLLLPIRQDTSNDVGRTLTLMCASISSTGTCDTGSYPVYQTVKTASRR
jgi:hypothetical protein